METTDNQTKLDGQGVVLSVFARPYVNWSRGQRVPTTDECKKELNRLGLVDGTVAAVAERRGVYRVLITERRDFSAIRIGSRFDARPETLAVMAV